MKQNSVERISISELRGWGYESIGWLLEEVKKAGGEIPEKYYPTENSPDQLASVRKARNDFGYHGLSLAFTWEKLYLEMVSVATEKRRQATLCSMQNQIRLLLDSLKSDEILLSRLSIRIPVDQHSGVGLFEIINGLQKLKDAVADEKRNIDPNYEPLLAKEKDISKRSCLLNHLAETYKEHLALDPRQGFTKTSNNPTGPFIVFIKCAFILAGEEALSQAALYQALRRANFMKQGDKD